MEPRRFVKSPLHEPPRSWDLFVNTPRLSALRHPFSCQTKKCSSVFLSGGLLTIVTERKKDLSISSADSNVDSFGLSMRGGAALLAGWLALLIIVIIGKNSTSYHKAESLHWFEVRRSDQE